MIAPTPIPGIEPHLIVAIDPGTRESAMVSYEPNSGTCGPKVIAPNTEIVDFIPTLHDLVMPPRSLLIEKVESYGMPVGADVFDTVFWAGRFAQAWGGPFEMVPRRTVKLQLCGSSRAKDANIRQALIDRFPATGGGKTPQIGTKASPGPLYGFKSHLWAALGVAVAWAEKQRESAGRPAGEGV